MDSKDLSTKELLQISMYQSGMAPSAIALKLQLPATNVRQFLKSPKAIAYRLEQEDTTDEMIQTLYRDGADALRRALVHPDPKFSLKAAELVFKVLGKMKTPETADTPKIHIVKLMQVIQAPPTAQEIEEAKRHIDTGRAYLPQKTVQLVATDSEQGESDGTVQSE